MLQPPRTSWRDWFVGKGGDPGQEGGGGLHEGEKNGIV